MIVRFLAAVAGVVAILLPLVSVIRATGRARGSTVGSGAALRRWQAVLAVTLALVAVGVLLWQPLPVAQRGWLATLLLALGSLTYFPAIGLYLWGLAALGRNFGVSTFGGADVYAGHRLVRGGPFRFVRHPMYLAVILAAIGALLIFRTWAMVLFAPTSLVVIRRAGHEEALLEAEYGDLWREYARATPKWLPRLGRRGR